MNVDVVYIDYTMFHNFSFYNKAVVDCWEFKYDVGIID